MNPLTLSFGHRVLVLLHFELFSVEFKGNLPYSFEVRLSSDDECKDPDQLARWLTLALGWTIFGFGLGMWRVDFCSNFAISPAHAVPPACHSLRSILHSLRCSICFTRFAALVVLNACRTFVS
jgi:hypothetical protein